MVRSIPAALKLLGAALEGDDELARELGYPARFRSAMHPIGCWKRVGFELEGEAKENDRTVWRLKLPRPAGR